MLADTGELGGLMRRIEKSYWEREQQIAEAFTQNRSQDSKKNKN
jgi:hypothetical protein